MKCQRLFIAKHSILSICVVGSLVLIPAARPFACDHSSQADTGGSTSDSSDSSGSSGSASSADQDSSSTDSAASNHEGNGPVNFRFIECSNPLWSDFLPCFKRMVKEREAFVSQPKED